MVLFHYVSKAGLVNLSLDIRPISEAGAKWMTHIKKSEIQKAIALTF
jgi:hypothetical protein